MHNGKQQSTPARTTGNQKLRTGTSPRATLAVLTGLNFLNYIDRYVLFAVLPLIQKEPGFHQSDFRYGLLTTSFFLCYMIAAPCSASLPTGDRGDL
jgi:MFS family permease